MAPCRALLGASRVIERIARIRIHLPTSCPEGQLFRHVALSLMPAVQLTRVADHTVRAPMAHLFRGNLADTEFIRRQQPLPETTDELCAVARSLGAAESAIYLGDKATERVIKSLSNDSGKRFTIRSFP